MRKRGGIAHGRPDERMTGGVDESTRKERWCRVRRALCAHVSSSTAESRVTSHFASHAPVGVMRLRLRTGRQEWEVYLIVREPTKNGDKVKVTFVLPADDEPGNAFVAGDFNSWNPGATMLRRRDDIRSGLPDVEHREAVWP